MTTTTPQAGPLLVNRTKAMELLGIRDPRVINRLIQQGKIKAVRIGGRYRINVSSGYAYASGE